MNSEFPWIQLVSSASLTLMGLTVSIVAAIFTYRNNFGWAPLALVTSIGLSAGGGTGKYNAQVDIEIWNRRKYPVVVRHISIRIDGLNIVEDLKNPNPMWHHYRKSLISDDEHAIAAQTHEKHSAITPFEAASLDVLECPIMVEIAFFDPRLNKMLKTSASGLYSFNSSRDQRGRAPDWFESLSA